MESLSEEIWDIVIAGTALPQSLLSLALSRSDLKILHVDKHGYYGGIDAGLSLDEATEWVDEQNNSQQPRSARIWRSTQAEKLANSRAYTLSLHPQIIYASTSFLPALVTSQLHNQIDFLAVGSWWTLKEKQLKRIPSTREDVFADESLSRRDKIGLMKFLRYIVQDEDATDSALELDADIAGVGYLQDVLTTKFKIPPWLQSPLAALALTKEPVTTADFGRTVSRIQRHMKSMNYFGPGFAAVYPKYAGNAEIAQVACRAGAVGGTVYLLGHGIDSIRACSETDETEFAEVALSNGTVVKARNVVGSPQDLPQSTEETLNDNIAQEVPQLNHISIVASPLRSLFPQTSENGPVPAVAIVFVEADSSDTPIYLQVHSEDTGECPTDQCVIYASALLQNSSPEVLQSRFEIAILNLLRSQTAELADDAAQPSDHAEVEGKILWSLSHTSSGLSAGSTPVNFFTKTTSPPTITFSPRHQDIAFDDSVLKSVRAVWQDIVGANDDADQFLVFSDRNQDENQ